MKNINKQYSVLAKNTFLFLAILFASSSTFALVSEADCGASDIRDGMNQEMREHFSTPRDQATIGWCYAFTTSDLLSAELGRPVSSTHVAANYNQRIRSNPLLRGFFFVANAIGRTPTNDSVSVREGGFVRQATLYNMRQDFLCSEEGLPFNSEAGNGTISHIQFLEELSSFIVERQGGSINLAECSGFTQQQSVNPFLSGNQASLQSVAQELASGHIDESLANIARTACAPQHRIPVSESRVLRRNNPAQGQGPRGPRQNDRWLSQLNGALESGRPVGLEYNVGAFSSKGEGQTLAHASVIIARKWENGQCLFKVRNSWGPSCDQYNSEVISGCDESEGAFWISDQNLLDTATNISFIEGN